VAAHRVDLADDGDVDAFLLRSDRCPHAGKAGANDQDVVLEYSH
jgi:hypothetical protein